jgi:dTDP-4-amino-4,6-dideoxygalactose transaminase
LQAAVLRVKLPYLNAWNEARREHADYYTRLLSDTGMIAPVAAGYGKHAYHLYVIQCDNREHRREMLTSQGISTGIHYPIPIHRQIASIGVGRVAGDMTVTEQISDRILSLPMYAELERPMIEYIAACLQNLRVPKEAAIAG